MWLLNEYVFYEQIQAVKTGLFWQFIVKVLDKLFCLTNKKCWNQFWQLELVQEIYIFLRFHGSFIWILKLV